VDAATAAAAWRLLEAGDTLCLSQVETLGMRLLLRRARDAYGEGPHAGSALQKLEDLAQLLALWRPGAYGPEREQAYFAVRFGGERPTYPHPAMARVLDTTAGQLLYADQLLGLIKLLGFDHAWADRYRRALAGGRRAGRDELERELRERARQQGWTPDQVSALVALLVEHVGYLYHHGHALAMAQHAFRQACLKVNPATAATFFAEVMNNGGSSYGLGAAVEEARRFGVVLLPPCVNRSGLHFLVEHDSPEVEALGDKARTIAGAVRVPLTAIRGLGPQAAEHIVAVRGVFGSYTSLVDFSRRVDPSLVGRHDLLLLIKLGAFSFTGLSRAQLTLAERYYAGSADLLRAVDRDPSGLATVEEDLAQSAAKFLDVAEWPPEVLAAQELAHLGFYVQAPLEVQRHAQRLAEEFGVVSIAELGDYPDRARVSVGAVITNLRHRTTRKGQRMAWLTLADGTGAIECAIFPRAYEQLGPSTALREGAFLVARGNLAHEEATGSKLFISEIVPLDGSGTRLSALAVAVEQPRVRSTGT
jgi:DNA polymerase-3 subunit alpha